MEVYTIQMAQWRKAKERGIQLLDTTVKSGDKVFAPAWGMVEAVKSGRISEEEYSLDYRRMMMMSLKNNASRWKEVIRGEPVAIACYCGYGLFCHRHLLVQYFDEICTSRGIPFEYKGEIQ